MRRWSMTGAGAVLLVSLLAAGPSVADRTNAQPAPSVPMPNLWQKRWLRIALNMLVDKNFLQAQQLVRRAAQAGYNGVVMADFKLNTWWDRALQLEHWQENMLQMRRLAGQLGLEFWVSVVDMGRAGGILMHDPNLAAGHPVKDAVLVAHEGRLVPIQTAELVNPSFEEHQGNRVKGWFHDEPGSASFVDSQVVKIGKVSLRFEIGARANKAGNNRVAQTIGVKPFHQYRVRYWVKLDDVTGYFQSLVLSYDSKRHLQSCGLREKGDLMPPAGQNLNHKTTDWCEQVIAFNSLTYDRVRLYMGIWSGKTGRLWIDGVRIEEVPTLNLLRRESLPLTIVGEDGTPYIEGKDFEKVVDLKMGHAKWAGTYDVVHEPPTIRLTPNSRIRDGQRVLLSCCHALTMPGSQINCSLIEPKVFEIIRQTIRHNRELLHPDGWFLQYDEMRTGGWEPQETAQFKTTGELLAYNVRRVSDIVRQEGGGKPMCVWSDMFDPNHNAHEYYYMVNNTLAGSWEGLPKDMIIVTWVPWRKSVKFFAGRGRRQIVAGYYDGDVDRNYASWVEATRGLPGLLGTVYCTWRNNWADIERYARVWWGAR